MSFKNHSDKSNKKLAHLLSLGHRVPPECTIVVITKSLISQLVLQILCRERGYNNSPRFSMPSKLGKNGVVG